MLATATVNMSFWERIKPPVDISTNGHLIDWLFNYTTIMITFFFILVCAGLFGFSWLYSAKRNKKAYYTYGNKKIHVMVATLIGALVFFAVDMNITRIANNDFTKVFMNFPKGDDVIKIEIMAQQWMWNIRYAGKDGKFNTDDDILTTNDLRLPVGKKVVVQLISKDVIHSFFLPNIRRKVDAMPGRISRLWFELTKTGEYEIACAEMCGTHHYLMKGKLIVYSQEQYEQWLSSAHSIALAENDNQDADRYWGWQWQE
jgi:cytochrome c oxidase subunit 2